jgi:hypothetical protein
MLWAIILAATMVLSLMCLFAATHFRNEGNQQCDYPDFMCSDESLVAGTRKLQRALNWLTAALILLALAIGQAIFHIVRNSL